jgi:predicted dehydrogenase
MRHVETRMIVVLPSRSDIRYRLDLAGGATMDVGCYSIHQLRTLAGAEPTVTSARARLRALGVDRWMRADLAFGDGRTGRMTCGLLAAALPTVDLRVEGDEGTLRVRFPNRPQLSRGITVRRRDGSTSREQVTGGTTFSYQLQAFCGAVLRGEPLLTPVADAVANMRVIDAIYAAAGLPRREPSP